MVLGGCLHLLLIKKKWDNEMEVHVFSVMFELGKKINYIHIYIAFWCGANQ